MSPTIEQIEQQIVVLQQTLDELKNPKLQITREFTGQYFAPYQGKQYRRMESQGIPIWECFLDIKREWVIVDKMESRNLEMIYLRDYTSSSNQSIPEIVQEPVAIMPEIVEEIIPEPIQKIVKESSSAVKKAPVKETVNRSSSAPKRITSKKS